MDNEKLECFDVFKKMKKNHVMWETKRYTNCFSFSFVGYTEVGGGRFELQVEVEVVMKSMASIELMEEIRRHSKEWTTMNK